MLGNWLWEVKRVVDDQIKRRPFPNLPVTSVSLRTRQITGLTNEVHGRPRVNAAQIVKYARIPAVLRERAAAGRPQELSS